MNRRPEDAPHLRLLPAAGDEQEPERGGVLAVPEPAAPAVLEGEIVHRPRVVATVAAVVTHDRTKTAARHVLYVAVGASVVARRLWDSRTTARYERMMRSAEAAGDHQAALEWEDRRSSALRDRHSRRMDLLALPVKAVIALAYGAGGLLAVLVGVGMLLAIADQDAHQLAAPTLALARAVRLIVVIIGVAWGPILLAAPWVIVLALWQVGRTHATATPSWSAADDSEPAGGREVIPNEGAILNALRNLGISRLNQAFKNGWRPRFPLATGRDGKGWRTQLELPAGVTVDMVNSRKGVLAHNLVRLPIEVWPTEPKTQPGVLDLWVADQGSLTGPVPPWPLLNGGIGDYFKGVPVGVDIRGSVVLGRLFEANYGIAGMMGSGKSTMIITLLLGALLDPLVEADVFVMATNADYDPMKPRLNTLLTGPGDEIVEACLDRLRRGYNDLTARGQALQEHGERAVTRKLAEKDERLRPRILVVDECQALYMHPDLGEEAADLTVKLISAARKYALTLIFATPEPSSASLPRKVMAVTSNKACFAIGDQQSNDAILGTGSYKSGISAVSLEPKTADGPGDIGTAMARGFQPKPGLLRSYYVAKGDGIDQVTPVIERAMKLRDKLGLTARSDAEDEQRDLLDDLDEVLSTERVRLSDLPGRLRELAPHWQQYQQLNGERLWRLLTAEDVRTVKTGNVRYLDPAEVRAEITRRSTADGEE